MNTDTLVIPRFKPKKKLASYLENVISKYKYLNNSLYEKLLYNEEYKDIFDPLDFFNLLYRLDKTSKVNSGRPISFLTYIQRLNLSELQMYFLLENLIMMRIIRNPASLDSIFVDPIEEEKVRLERKLFPDKERIDLEEYQYKFESVETQLLKLNKSEDKIKFLIEKKYHYLKNKHIYDFVNEDDDRFSDITFAEKCDLEIEKIRKLENVEEEIEHQESSSNQNTESESGKNNNIEDLNKIDIRNTEPLFYTMVEEAFAYMLKRDRRNHQIILSEEDHEKLIQWVKEYFENDLRLPSISDPIKRVNTSQGKIVWTFLLLFKEVYPNRPRPDSLFQLIKICFYQYRNKNIDNLRKTKRPLN